MNNSYVQQYSKVGMQTGVASADPHRLILMLLEGALTSVIYAKKEMEAGNIAEKGEAISKVIRIIGELDASLNMEAGGELAHNLRRLYDYMSIRLIEANVNNASEKLSEVATLFFQLKSGWEGIEEEVRNVAQQNKVRPPEEMVSYGKV